jgi:hypothetical protein
MGPSERRVAVALIDPNEQTTLQSRSDTKPRQTVLAAYFRTAEFVSEPKGYRARNRKFESTPLQRRVCKLSVPVCSRSTGPMICRPHRISPPSGGKTGHRAEPVDVLGVASPVEMRGTVRSGSLRP